MPNRPAAPQVFQHPTGSPKGIRRNERSWESLSTAGLQAAGQAKATSVSEALVYGLPPSILAKALSPKSILCDSPFELTIDDYRFIGRHAPRIRHSTARILSSSVVSADFQRRCTLVLPARGSHAAQMCAFGSRGRVRLTLLVCAAFAAQHSWYGRIRTATKITALTTWPKISGRAGFRGGCVSQTMSSRSSTWLSSPLPGPHPRSLPVFHRYPCAITRTLLRLAPPSYDGLPREHWPERERTHSVLAWLPQPVGHDRLSACCGGPGVVAAVRGREVPSRAASAGANRSELFCSPLRGLTPAVPQANAATRCFALDRALRLRADRAFCACCLCWFVSEDARTCAER